MALTVWNDTMGEGEGPISHFDISHVCCKFHGVRLEVVDFYPVFLL